MVKKYNVDINEILLFACVLRIFISIFLHEIIILCADQCIPKCFLKQTST